MGIYHVAFTPDACNFPHGYLTPAPACLLNAANFRAHIPHLAVLTFHQRTIPFQPLTFSSSKTSWPSPMHHSTQRTQAHTLNMRTAASAVMAAVRLADSMLTMLLSRKGRPEMWTTPGPGLLVTLPLAWW